MKTIELKRKEAASRRISRGLRTPKQQLALIDKRRGESKRERERLLKLI